MTKSALVSTRKKWLLATLGLIIVGWLGLVAAIEFLAPNWVENTLAKQISARLGVAIRIEHIRTDAFEGKLTLSGVSIDDQQGQPLIGFRELQLDYSWLSLLSPVWVLESATLVAPSIHLRVPAEGPLTLMQLVPASDGPGVEAPRWQLKHLRIEQGELSYRDERVRPARAFAISDWGLTLDELGTESANGLAELHAQLPAGARLDWQGTIGLQPLTSAGHLTLSQLSLPQTLAWLPEQLPLTINEGRLSLDVHYEAALQPALALTINDSRIALNDLSLALLKTSDNKPLATLDALEASGLSLAYPSAQWAADKLTLTGANIRIEREASGEFTLLKALAGPPRKVVNKSQAESPAQAWAGSLKQAKIRNVMVNYRDASTQPQTVLSLGPLSLDATPKALATQDSVTLALTTVINTSAQMSLRGELGMPSVRANMPPATPYFSGQLSLDKLALTALDGLIRQSLAIRLAAGEFSSAGELQWQTAAAPSWSWHGDSAINSLRLLSARGQPLLSLSALRLDGVRAQGTPAQVAIQRVLIDRPKLRISRAADGTLNLATLSKSSSRAPTATPDVFIDTLALRGGTFAIADAGVQPTMATALSQVSGSVRRIDLSGRQLSQITLRGYLPAAAAIALDGTVNLIQPSKTLDLSLRAERLALPPYSSYASRYAGYGLNNGLLWADLRYLIREGALKAENALRINDFSWGERSNSPDATSLPVRLGTALLKDVNGEIHLDLPVRGNLSDPEFRVWPIVWQTLGNLLTRAAAAPFKLLGGMTGGGDDLTHIAFSRHSSALSESARAQIKRLAESLQGKPELQLRIAGHSDSAQESLEATSQAALSPEAASQQLYDLAKARAVAVKDALVADGISSEQLVLEQPKATSEASLSVSLSITLAD